MTTRPLARMLGLYVGPQLDAALHVAADFPERTR